VAAGGGSRLFFRGGMFVVGPESAGAHPGPACYMKGSFLIVSSFISMLYYSTLSSIMKMHSVL